MAAKIQIATTAHSPEEVASILSEYTSATLLERTQLFGGYSGSNYRVDLDDGCTFVLKITNGYSAEHAELMCRTAHHLGEVGYKDCCLPILKIADESIASNNAFRFVSTKEEKGVPAFLLTHMEGRQADIVMREHPLLANAVMKGIGGGLARMHAAASGITQDVAGKLGIRWYQTDGGCCDVQDQVDGKILSKILMCTDDRKRDLFLDHFYSKELSSLRVEMQLANRSSTKEGAFTFTHGVSHGDPFADNVLVRKETGELSAFIDIEDFCVGPLIFDLCCCVIGCCFKVVTDKEDSTQVLDMALLEALLIGYCAHRKLPQIERDHFVPFMRLTLLCNCSWRFVKFNVKLRDDNVDEFPEEARNSYLELQERVEYLHHPDVVQSIRNLLEKHTC